MSRYYEELYELARLLLAEEGYEGLTRRLLERVVAVTGAESGFLVTREEGSYRLCFEIGHRREELPDAARQFSSSLVRETIETGEAIYIANLAEDPRFSKTESAETLGPCSILVSPLRCGEEVYGVVYLENRRQVPSFDEESRLFLEKFSQIAGLFLLRSLEREDLRERNRQLEGDLFARHDFSGIVTRHPTMIRLLEQVAQMAGADAPVLIRGETGTGKELVARALHLNSPRRRGPFVTVNCAALSSSLLDSELFGHVSGAFTGARRERRGRLAAAESGTLLLDEVGEIPQEVQAKLLRFLQFGEIQRVGSDRVETVDTRVLAATHRDLRRMIAEGSFREDLYFRLKVLEVEVPPLRARRGDVTLLTQHFLERSWRSDEPPRLTPALIQRLRTYSYPGNVRELAHLIERLCVLARGPEIDVDMLPPELLETTAAEEEVAETWPELTAEALKAAKKAAGERVERSFLDALMAHHDGNVSEASRESGIHRTYLHKLLGRHPNLPS